MSVFDRFERRLERLVEGAFGRVFKGEAAPADIAHALQRETDDRKVVVGAGRVIAPNTFVVALGDHDHQRLGPYAEPLGEAFSEMLQDHARQAGYSFAGPISVDLEHDPDLDTGRFSIRSDPAAALSSRPPAAPSPPPGPPWPASNAPPTMVAAAPLPPVPATPPPRAVQHRLVLPSGPDGSDLAAASDQQSVPILAPVTVVGRSVTADIQLADPGVSRRHAELHLDGATVRLIDAGSTNGTTVNGERVGKRQLRSGDRIQMGNTVLIYRANT